MIGELDPLLWSNLPDELMLAVLAWLPLRTLTTMRLVCKKWSAMWYCPVFMQLRSRAAPPEKYCLLFRSYGAHWFGTRVPYASCYDPVLNKIHKRMFKFFPSKYAYQVLATANGLLFCVERPARVYTFTNFWPEKEGQSLQMIVCNPLRETCSVRLPERLGNWRPCVVGMIGSRTNRYQVILGSFLHGTEVYDSCSKSWKLIPARGRSFNGPPGFNPSIISRNGCMLYIGRAGGCADASVCVYNSVTELWSSFELPHCGKDLQYLQLEDCGGRLILVGHRKSVTESRGFLCFGDAFVWERVGEDIMNGFWRERFSPHPQYPVHYPVLPPNEESLGRTSGAQDLLCYTRATFGRSSQLEGRFEHLSTYDVSLNKWWSTTRRVCDHARVVRRGCGAGVTYRSDFLFEPRIEALP